MDKLDLLSDFISEYFIQEDLFDQDDDIEGFVDNIKEYLKIQVHKRDTHVNYSLDLYVQFAHHRRDREKHICLSIEKWPSVISDILRDWCPVSFEVYILFDDIGYQKDTFGCAKDAETFNANGHRFCDGTNPTKRFNFFNYEVESFFRKMLETNTVDNAVRITKDNFDLDPGFKVENITIHFDDY